ncbi:MAG: GFA family protein [Gammaproteobacteria bacterium]|nr:GFA family protein [Gammaproteobacteria bacterium]
MYKGGCLCGAVRYEIHDGISDIVYCHCSLCRKAQGSAFATNGNVDASKFVFSKGEDMLTAYEATPGQKKYFCKQCGSPIISKNESAPDKVRIRLGTIESDISERPGCHIFVGSKANWEEISDDLPGYDEYKSGKI